jgi:hypothetical protein
VLAPGWLSTVATTVVLGALVLTSVHHVRALRTAAASRGPSAAHLGMAVVMAGMLVLPGGLGSASMVMAVACAVGAGLVVGLRRSAAALEAGLLLVVTRLVLLPLPGPAGTGGRAADLDGLGDPPRARRDAPRPDRLTHPTPLVPSAIMHERPGPPA